MKYLIAIGAILASPLSAARAAALPTVVISEVGWAGSSLSTADEYVELANLTDRAMDLSGYRLTGGGDLTLPAGSVLPASGTFVISNFAADDARCALTHAEYVNAAVSLSNTALGISLVAPDGTVVDHAGDGGKPPAGRTSSSGSGARSMVRTVPLANGATATSWKTADIPDGMKAGPDIGTPGMNDLASAIVASAPADPPPAAQETPATETLPAPAAEPLPTPTQDPTAPEAPAVTPVQEPIPEAIAVPVPAVASEPAPITYPPQTLIINELLPIPATGAAEFVEILNPYPNVIPLNGWAIQDASGAKTPLPDQLLGNGQTVVLENPKGKLNNDGDTVTLLAPDGSVNDAVAYGKDGQKAGESFAREGDALVLTMQPTPGAENVVSESVTTTVPAQEPEPAPVAAIIPVTPALPEPPPTPAVPTQPTYVAPAPAPLATPPAVAATVLAVAPQTHPATAAAPAPKPAAPKPAAPKPAAPAAKKPAAAKAPAKRAASASRVTVADIAALASGKRLTVEATVTALPGSLGKQLMAVADETGGITVFKSDGKFGTFALGDRVEVVGVMSSTRGMARIRLDAKSAVRMLGHGDAPAPKDVAAPGEDDVGNLIRVSGLFTRTAKDPAVVDTSDASVPIRLPDGAKAERGARVTVMGILVSSDGVLRLLPRTASDIQVDKPAPAAAAATSPKTAGASGAGAALTGAVLLTIGLFAAKPRLTALINRYAKRPALALPAQATD